MRYLTYEEWNTTNRAVVLRVIAKPPVAALAVFVFGAAVEEEAAEHGSNLDEMGFSVDDVPLGLSVWEGGWQCDLPDQEGCSDMSYAVGSYRRPTEDELGDVLAGRSPWAPEVTQVAGLLEEETHAE